MHQAVAKSPERVRVMLRRRKQRAPDVYIPADVQRSIQERLSRVEGHVRGVKRMLDERRQCHEILVQIAAVRAALAQVAIVLTESHLEVCVAQALRTNDSEKFVEMFKESLVQFMRQG